MFINKHLLHWKDWPTVLPHPSLPPIAPPSLAPPLHAVYIYTTAKQSKDDTLYGRNSAPSPNEAKNSTQRHIAEFCYCTT